MASVTNSDWPAPPEVARDKGGMLDLTGCDVGGLARCFSCGWEGVPSSHRNVLSHDCPKCQGFGNESDMREHQIPAGQVVRLPVKQKKTHKQGRNEPCLCGSGLKHKRCCGR